MKQGSSLSVSSSSDKDKGAEGGMRNMGAAAEHDDHGQQWQRQRWQRRW